MRTFRPWGISLAAALLASCSSSAVPTGAPAPPLDRVRGGASSRSVGPNGPLPRELPARRGWIVPNKKNQLLYVSNEESSEIDVFSIPSDKLTGQITDGISQPEGIATDKNGNLYVADLGSDTVTVYPHGSTSPSQTLTESDGPDDVAVTEDGHVLAGDIDGGVDVYAPGASSPSSRLTNPDIGSVDGVGVDRHDNVYAAGENDSGGPVVVEFANMSGSGKNLNLTGLLGPTGALVDKKGNLVISDYELPGINIYPPGSTSPSATIANSEDPDRSALNKKENLIYVPEAFNGSVNIYKYPSGTLLTTISLSGSSNFVSGTALSPAPKP